MSDAALEDGAAPAKPKARGRGIERLIPLGLLMLLPIAPATFTVLTVFMMPTMLLVFFRLLRLPGAAGTVAGLNFAGTLPALHHMWTTGNDFQTAYLTLFNLEFMFLNLAAAAIGVSLLWISPFIARTWVDIAGNRLHTRAKAERERLIDEWGTALEEVTVAQPDNADVNASASDPEGATEPA